MICLVKNGENKMPKEKKRKRSLFRNKALKCNHENNSIFLHHLALHETFMCLAEAATWLDRAPAPTVVQPATPTQWY